MEIRFSVDAITAIGYDGKKMELFHSEFDSNCGAYSEYQRIGNKEHRILDLIDDDVVKEGTELPFLTIDDCKCFIEKEITENMKFALNEVNLNAEDIKEIEVYYTCYAHHTPIIRNYLIM